MVRTRGVLRGHPGNFPLERGQRELESCSKSSLALFSVFHLGPVPPKDGSPLQAKRSVPLSANSVSEHETRYLGDSGMEQGEDS